MSNQLKGLQRVLEKGHPNIGTTVVRKRVHGTLRSVEYFMATFGIPIIIAGIVGGITGMFAGWTPALWTFGGIYVPLAAFIHSMNFWEREEEIRMKIVCKDRLKAFDSFRSVLPLPQKTKRKLMSKAYHKITGSTSSFYNLPKKPISIAEATHEIKTYRVTSWKGVTYEQVAEPISISLWDNTLYDAKIAHGIGHLIDDAMRTVETENRKSQNFSKPTIVISSKVI